MSPCGCSTTNTNDSLVDGLVIAEGTFITVAIIVLGIYLLAPILKGGWQEFRQRRLQQLIARREAEAHQRASQLSVGYRKPS